MTGLWWWVEKSLNGVWETYTADHDGWWLNVYGAVMREATFSISFEEPGTYRILARARDDLYQQSEIVTSEFTVVQAP